MLLVFPHLSRRGSCSVVFSFKSSASIWIWPASRCRLLKELAEQVLSLGHRWDQIVTVQTAAFPLSSTGEADDVAVMNSWVLLLLLGFAQGEELGGGLGSRGKEQIQIGRRLLGA